MIAKLLVLYPHPIDEAEFERDYVGHHLPLMRKLLGPNASLPTFKTVAVGDTRPPFYRVAEILFADMAALRSYLTEKDKVERGRASSVQVSTGGDPIFLVCDEQPEI